MFYFTLIFLTTVITITNAAKLVTVSTSRGDVVGTVMDLGMNMSAEFYGYADVFSGIPFAQPPLRFGVKFFAKKYISFRNLNEWVTFPRIHIMQRLYNQCVFKDIMLLKQ